jgi:hypothetical protein
MLFTLPIAIIGYAVIANVMSAQVRFGMTCLMAIGMYSSVPCVLVWNSNNSAGHYKRATTSALQLAVANCGGFVASKSRFGKFATTLTINMHEPAFVYPNKVSNTAQVTGGQQGADDTYRMVRYITKAILSFSACSCTPGSREFSFFSSPSRSKMLTGS